MPDDPDLDLAAGAWNRLHQRPPSTLYHYTTAQGLLGLISERRLWATNARFMNDPSEIQYARRLIERELAEASVRHEEEIGRLSSNLVQRFFLKLREKMYSFPKVKEWTDNAIGVFDEQGGAYIACFCRHPDLLSQWRGYGATGGGYAVGLASKQLARPAEGILLRKVIYDRRDQLKILRRWTAAIFALDFALRREQQQALTGAAAQEAGWLQTLQKSVDRERRLRELAQQGLAGLNKGMERFSRFLAECLICFKDPAYSEEKEWRLIQFGGSNPTIQYRVGRGCLLPYVELDLTSSAPRFKGRLPLRQITYGPVLESALVERSLKTVLTTHGYTDVVNRVARSRVPYRG